jgi:hypothetical protein
VHILVLHYSQTGQLTRVLRSIVGPLENISDVSIDWRELKPVRPYPFPWRFLSFFDAFPESVYLDPPPVEQAGLRTDRKYDLVVLGYQVWFLAPAQPVVAFLKSPEARLLDGVKVITVVGCRNMWATAHQSMLKLLDDVGAHLVDNVVLTDEGPMWATFITTPWWLLTGNKGPLLGIFPAAGISEDGIRRAARFGRALKDALPKIAASAAGPYLRGLQAAKVQPLTLLGERIGHRSFRIWGWLVRAAGQPGSMARKPILLVYVCFLVFMILTVLPFTATAAAVSARLSRRVKNAAAALEMPSGSGSERLGMYDPGR